jgi:hypothetical protein
MEVPEKGSAMVKFMTPEGCQKYFDATENGIEVPGDKTKTVVFVERQPGPNSVNDVLQNCIDGDATRCIRALDADTDWSEVALRKLARGTSKIPRNIDIIKRGETATSVSKFEDFTPFETCLVRSDVWLKFFQRFYIEFRFANIYDALNFKNELLREEDWEACTIIFAPDPCDTARGVHIKEEDEV